MFVAWFAVITTFLVCTYTTVKIFDSIKEIDENDLANLQTQLKNMAGNDKEFLKQAI